MEKAILVINSGSSSIKISLFKKGEEGEILYKGGIDYSDRSSGIPMKILNFKNNEETQKTIYLKEDENVIKTLEHVVTSFLEEIDDVELCAVGHRVVHAGLTYNRSIKIDDNTLIELEKCCILAPLHQPYNLNAIKAIKIHYPGIPQVACFDTAFHADQSELAITFALPRKFKEEGIVKYGFHGISYEDITKTLLTIDPNTIDKRIIVAHLGNGASCCAIKNQKSVDTTMGFTALDGLIMGTRSGSIDPGIILYLMQEKGFTLKDVHELLYKKSGLLGLSGISHDMKVLEDSDDPAALEAINVYCYNAAKHIGSLITTMGGVDLIVFTAGIGENSHNVRKKICSYLEWLGLRIDKQKNESNKQLISSNNSIVKVYVIPTNEERRIAIDTYNVIFS